MAPRVAYSIKMSGKPKEKRNLLVLPDPSQTDSSNQQPG